MGRTQARIWEEETGGAPSLSFLGMPVLSAAIFIFSSGACSRRKTSSLSRESCISTRKPEARMRAATFSRSLRRLTAFVSVSSSKGYTNASLHLLASGHVRVM